MVIICYTSDIMGYDGRTLELSNAPLHMKQYTTSIEKKTLKPSSILDLVLDLPATSPLTVAASAVALDAGSS